MLFLSMQLATSPCKYMLLMADSQVPVALASAQAHQVGDGGAPGAHGGEGGVAGGVQERQRRVAAGHAHREGAHVLRGSGGRLSAIPSDLA